MPFSSPSFQVSDIKLIMALPYIGVYNLLLAKITSSSYMMRLNKRDDGLVGGIDDDYLVGDEDDFYFLFIKMVNRFLSKRLVLVNSTTFGFVVFSFICVCMK
jgi:hypothetical protein